MKKYILFVTTFIIMIFLGIKVCAIEEIERQLYYKIENNKVTITQSSLLGDVVIPEEIEGYPVTKIAGHAFTHKFYSSIILPKTLTDIESLAFLNCNITDIEIPKSVKSIGDYAIGYYWNITNSTIIYFPVKDMKIYGYIGTVAETYAQKNGFTFIALDESEVTTTTTVTTAVSTTTETTVSTTATTPIETTATTTAVSNTTAEQTTTTETTSIITTATTTTTEPIKIKGDANGNNKLDVRDCAFIASALANGTADDLTEISDFNSDGKINVRDAAAIANHLASK